MKFLILFVIVCAVAFSQAQFQPGGFGPYGGGGFIPYAFSGFPSSQFFQQIVLQSEAQRLLTKPDFPLDLQQRIVDTLSNAETGFNTCNTAGTGAALPWLQIRCITGQLQISKNALKAIEDEATARAAAAAAAPAAAPAAGNA